MPPKNKLFEGLALFVFLLTIIFGALFLANSFNGAKEPVRCALQFPKWAGCVMAAHENLAGGLIAGFLALFAAWWAATVLYEQMRREDEKRQIELRRQTTEDQMNASALIVYLDLLMSPFDHVGGAPGAWMIAWDELIFSGRAISFNRPGPAPYHLSAISIAQRVSEISRNVDDHRAQVTKSNMQNASQEAKISKGIESLVHDIRGLRTVVFERYRRETGVS